MLGGDPLFNNSLYDSNGVNFAVLGIVALKVVVCFVFLLVATMLMVWFERKLIGDMQNRIGPNRAGPWGILQTLADGIKLFFKEHLVPEKAEPTVYVLAPFLAFVPAFLLFAIVPVTGNFADGGDGTVTMFGYQTFVQLADPPIGVLFALGLSSIAVYGVMLAGWSSGSKYPLLGSVRATAQMVSYEAAMGLAAVAVVLVTGTLSTHGMVMVQAGPGPFGWVPNWGVVLTAVVPFLIFMIAGAAELNRPPFDLVEAEQELVGGFNTEYSSIRFALFYLAEFMNTITMSAIFVTLFLGGPAGPAPWGPAWVWGIAWFFAKLFVFLFIFIWCRATLPRFRYDQLMHLGWRLLIPLALGWALLLAAMHVSNDQGWPPGLTMPVALLVLIAAAGLLRSALARSREGRLADADLEGATP